MFNITDRLLYLYNRQLKYEQDLEFYSTARQLRWQKLKHQRKKTLKRLHKEKIQHRLNVEKTIKKVDKLFCKEEVKGKQNY